MKRARFARDPTRPSRRLSGRTRRNAARSSTIADSIRPIACTSGRRRWQVWEERKTRCTRAWTLGRSPWLSSALKRTTRAVWQRSRLWATRLRSKRARRCASGSTRTPSKRSGGGTFARAKALSMPCFRISRRTRPRCGRRPFTWRSRTRAPWTRRGERRLMRGKGAPRRPRRAVSRRSPRWRRGRSSSAWNAASRRRAWARWPPPRRLSRTASSTTTRLWRGRPTTT